jgi:hypothetical protein
MSEQEGLRYDVMVESALRGVVRDALSVAAESGLPGEHHFYITFRTDSPGVQLADYLRERYPSEMTIVIQHQFWNLKVLEDRFEVTLSFNDKPQELVIPFAAVTAFADPSVRFGLQFDTTGEEDDEVQPEEANQDLDQARTGPGDAAGSAAGDQPATEAGAEVITLDTFRKK